MRALIRGEEVITEPFSPYVERNLEWMTGKERDADGNYLKGDGWILVEDYVPPIDPEPLTAAEPVEERHVL